MTDPIPPTLAEAPPDPAQPLLKALSTFSADLAPRTRTEYASALRAVRAALARHRGLTLDDDVALLRLLVDGGRQETFLLVHEARAGWLEQGLAASTIGVRLVALGRLLTFARNLGLIDWTVEIPGVRHAPVRDMKGPPEEDYQTLLRACVSLRDEVAIRLMGDAGLRSEEAASLTVGSIERGARGAVVSLQVRRKGMRTGTALIPLYGRLAAALADLLRESPEALPDAPLLDISRHGIRALVRRLGKAAGVAVRPHGLRHRAATVAVERSGGDVVAVAAFLGHRDTRQVLRYFDKTTEAAARVAKLVAEEPGAG